MDFISNQVDDFFLSWEEKLSIPEDQLKLVFCWIAAIPLGFISHTMKNPSVRHAYSLFWGVVLTYICVKNWLFVTLFAGVVTYIIAVFWKKNCDWASLWFLLIYLGIFHTHRYFFDFYAWKLDGSMALMMMVCKLTYFTFYYKDGRLKELPTLLEYFGYLYFYPSPLMGPTHDVEIYLDYINLRKQYAQKYNVVKPALKQSVFALLYIITMKVLSPYLNTDFYWTQDFADMSLGTKLLYMHFTGFAIRCKYYGGWKFAQAGANASGISYRGQDKETGEQKFDKLLSMEDTYEIEIDIRKKTQCWNTSTQTWLKNVFYTRFSEKNSPQKSLALTFAVSAIWHGIHPAYYLGFAQWAFVNVVSKQLYRHRHLFENIPSPIRTMLAFIIGTLGMNFVGTPIQMVSMEKILTVYKSLHYLPFTGPIVVLVIFKLLKVLHIGQRQSQTFKNKSPQSQQLKESKQDSQIIQQSNKIEKQINNNNNKKDQ